MNIETYFKTFLFIRLETGHASLKFKQFTRIYIYITLITIRFLYVFRFHIKEFPNKKLGYELGFIVLSHPKKKC